MKKPGPANFTIEYLPEVIRKDIPALTKTMRMRIQNAIETRPAINPVAYGKPLQYSLYGQRRLRVGDHRIMYIIDALERSVTITAIKHRKDAYKKS